MAKYMQMGLFLVTFYGHPLRLRFTKANRFLYIFFKDLHLVFRIKVLKNMFKNLFYFLDIYMIK